MGIDMELMRRKLATLRGEGRGSDGPSHWFKPDEGDTDIRIVPTADGDPLKEMFFHYNVGDHRGGIVCPKRNFGERCPICEFASSVWREGVDNNDEESKKLAKSLFVRGRYFSPVVVRGRVDILDPEELRQRARAAEREAEQGREEARPRDGAAVRGVDAPGPAARCGRCVLLVTSAPRRG